MSEPEQIALAAEPVTAGTVDPNPWAAMDQPQPTPPGGGIDLHALADEQAAPAPPVNGYPFDWAGRQWRIKPQFDVRVVACLQSGDIGRALGLMLGKDQAAEMLEWDAPDGQALTDDVLAAMVQLAGGGGKLTAPES